MDLRRSLVFIFACCLSFLCFSSRCTQNSDIPTESKIDKYGNGGLLNGVYNDMVDEEEENTPYQTLSVIEDDYGTKISNDNIFWLCIIAYLVVGSGAWNVIPNIFNLARYVRHHSKQHFSKHPITHGNPANTTFDPIIRVPFESFINELDSSDPKYYYTILCKYDLHTLLKVKAPNSIVIPFFFENVLGEYYDYVACGFPFGASVGSLIIFIMNKVDPFTFLFSAVIFFIIGSLIVFFSCNTFMTLAGRILIGIATGFSAVAPSYLKQLDTLIKTIHPRSTEPTIPEKFFIYYSYIYPSFVLGCVASHYFFETLFLFSWRVINIITAIFSIIALILSFHYRSPLLRDKVISATKKESFIKVLFGKGLVSLLFMVSFHILQQFTFINFVFGYSNEILPNTPYLGIILGIVNLVFTVVYPLAQKFFDISSLGVVSGFGCGLSSFILAIGLKQKETVSAISGVISFIAFFAIGVGPIPWIISPKITDPEYSEAYIGIGALFNWLCFVLIYFFAPSLKRHIGYKVFYISGSFSLLFGLIFIFVRPLNEATGFFQFGRKFKYAKVAQTRVPLEN